MDKKYYNELNQRIQASGKSWLAGETSISLLPEFQRRLHLGYIPEEGEWTDKELEEQALLNLKKHLLTDDLPVCVDWRNYKGNNYVTTVKDQGSCGSCVAFGVVATLEARMRVIMQAPVKQSSGILPLLSEAQLFFCGGGAVGASCGKGWSAEPALKYCQESGLAPDNCFPYQPKDQSCILPGDWEQKITKVGRFHKINDPTAMKQWLSEKGPLVTRFNVYDDFYSYKKGVYHRVSQKLEGGHCISCIGYDEHQKAWICKNSWGKAWGIDGFFLIGYGECGIDASMWAVDSFSEFYPLYPGILLRDNFKDFGQVPVAGTLTTSPDIIPYGKEVINNPEKELKEKWFADCGKDLLANVGNYIYMRAFNLNTIEEDVKFHLYYSPASLLMYPGKWKDNALKTSGGQAYAEAKGVNQGVIVVASDSFCWKPAIIKDDHYCLVGRVETASHPNPIPELEQIPDFAKFISENPGFAWRNVSVVSKDIPDYSITLDYDQGKTTESMYFVITCLNCARGASVELTCGSTLPKPTINIPKRKIDSSDFVIGVESKIPAEFTGKLIFNYWKEKAKAIEEWQIRISAFYLSEQNNTLHSCYAIPIEGSKGPKKGILIGDYTIKSSDIKK